MYFYCFNIILLSIIQKNRIFLYFFFAISKKSIIFAHVFHGNQPNV